MYQMYGLDDSVDGTMFGIRLPYYMIPLFLANIGIIAKYSKKLPTDSLGIVLLVWIIFLSFNVFFLSDIIYLDFIRVHLWTTSYFASYLLIRNNPNRLQTLLQMFVIVFFISTVFFALSKYTLRYVAQLGFGTQSNIVFCVLTVFPWILLQKNRKYTLIICLVTMVVVLFSNKRSALIILFLCALPVIKYYYQTGVNKKYLTISLFLAAILFAFTFSYLNNTYLNNHIGERFAELSEDGGSNRDRIWQYTWNGYQNSPSINQIIGNGHYKVSKLGRATAAHNDFLEVLYDYGAIGFILYLLIHISIFRRMIYLRKMRHPFAYSYMAMWLIFVVMSFVSILIVQQRYLIYMGVYWGAIDGYLVSQRNKSYSIYNDSLFFKHI